MIFSERISRQSYSTYYYYTSNFASFRYGGLDSHSVAACQVGESSDLGFPTDWLAVSRLFITDHTSRNRPFADSAPERCDRDASTFEDLLILLWLAIH